MRIQIKPVVLTLLVGTITICNINYPVKVAVCIVVLFIIHSSKLDDIAIQLNLTMSPQDGIKFAAQNSTNTHDTSAAKQVYAFNTKSTAIGKPAQQQMSENEATKQLAAEKLATGEQPSKKSKNKKSKKQKAAKEALLSPKVAAPVHLEAIHIPEQTPLVPVSSSTNSEGEDGGGWKLVSRKRNITKRAREGKTNGIVGSSGDEVAGA